ncbi:MAG: VWFA-related Acidobacterial domain protein [Acidobacteria bacterium]|nr:VWFA-related Acidobacterial domain protein [Acidobacteriota bacterium]
MQGSPLWAKGFGLAVATLAVGALAQTPAPQPPPTFRTEANYVRVDVFPTTKGDVPVTDLTQADFEVLEGGVPQNIDQFERVVVRGGIPQDLRREPNSVEEGRQAAQNPRARIVVLFLDINHVSVDGSARIRKPLVDALDRLIGPDDLIAVMTPDMAARDITFARKTTTIDGFLTRYWAWGQRERLNSIDPQEQQYQTCYPGQAPMMCPDGSTVDDRGVADEMIERRKEKTTIDALHDLVAYLRGVREERKAVLAITDGWRLFQPHEQLARKVTCDNPIPQVGVDPRTGRLTGRTPSNGLNGPRPDSCEADRMTLANMDDDSSFRLLLDQANAANTSFYPVDPRGLTVFDESIGKPVTGEPPPGSTTIVPPSVDAARLRARIDSLRTLAEATDGLAIVGSNDLARGLKRVVDDLSSYYLLGYYSNGRLDGRFHPITVRIKRPGVQVRARRGYMAATPAEAATMARAAAGKSTPAAEPAEAAAAHAVDAAIAPLAGYTRDVPLRLQIAAGWKPGDTASAAMWVVGELGTAASVGDSWNDGFDATVTVTTAADATVGSGRIAVPRGGRTFRLAVTASQPLVPGDYVLRVGARAGAAAIPSRETARLVIARAPDATGALFSRRGGATGNKDVPTADLRFRRNEQVRVEIPTSSSDALTARLLDRTGKALAVPVAAALRDDPDGSRWATAQLALAPLAPGDYAIEITAAAGSAGGDRRMIAAFRVVP